MVPELVSHRAMAMDDDQGEPLAKAAEQLMQEKSKNAEPWRVH